MTKHVKEVGIQCTCDRCMPALYSTHCHGKLDVSSVSPNKHYTKNVTDVPIFEPGVQYDGLDLARKSIAYFDKPLDKMNDTQIDGVETFRKIYQWYFKDAFEAEDVFESFDTYDLEQMVRCFSEIFFFSAIPSSLTCVWDPTLEGMYGNAWAHGDKPTIRLHPTLTEPGVGRGASRLNTLIHETIHIFLERHVCRDQMCPTSHHNVGEGHGRAFMLIAQALDRVCPSLLGFDLGMSVLDMQTNWFSYLTHYMTLPSVCDLQTLGLYDDREPTSEYPYIFFDADKGKFLVQVEEEIVSEPLSYKLGIDLVTGSVV